MHLYPKSYLLNPIKGQTMILTVLTLGGTLLSISLVAGLLILFQIRQSGDLANSAKALFAADAGVEWYLKHKGLLIHPYTFKSTDGDATLSLDPVLFSNGASFEVITQSELEAKVIGAAGSSKRAFLISVGPSGPRGLLACNTDQQIDLVMIFDMTATQPNTDLMKTAGRAFIDKIMVGMTSNVHVGVTEVRNRINVLTNLTSDRSFVDTSISAISRYTLAPFVLHQAIANAIVQLESSVYDRDDNTAPDAILIITDSLPSSPGSVAIQSNNAKNENIKIYVVNVGSANDPTFLESISSGGGYYFESADFSTLEPVLVSDILGCS